MQIRVIMHPLPWRDTKLADGLDNFFTYVQWFNIVLQLGVATMSDPVTGMFCLRQAMQLDGKTRQGGVVPIKYFCAPLMLTLWHEKMADSHLTRENLLECSDNFWLNDYFDKETFHCMHV